MPPARVDARTEESINEALRRVLADRTTLLVAHRRSTLHLADRVVVMDGGRVVDQGRHEELAERSAYYRMLLTGLGEDAAEAATGRIEALSTITGGTTESAWTATTSPARGDGSPYAPSAHRASARGWVVGRPARHG